MKSFAIMAMMAVVTFGAEDFKFDTAMNATASPDNSDLLTLEMVYKLENIDIPIPKDGWIWFYSQIQNKDAVQTVPETWETVSCLVKFEQRNDDNADGDVSSFLGSSRVEDWATTSQSFAEFNTADKKENNWTANLSQPQGFKQIYTPAVGDAKETSWVSCATTSTRSTADYKDGDTVRIASGYKVRDSKRSNYQFESVSDREVTETTLDAIETDGAKSDGEVPDTTLGAVKTDGAETEDFKFDAAMTATASPDNSYWLTLESVYKLENIDIPIPKDGWVWFYSQIQNKGAAETWETVSCLVKFEQRNDPNADGTVSSYLGSSIVEDWATSGLSFKEFNTADKTEKGRWMPNMLRPTGFMQWYEAAVGDAKETSWVSCATTSTRSTQDYKVGDTFRIAHGYKVRDLRRPDYQFESVSDREFDEITFGAVATNGAVETDGAMSLYGSAIAMTLTTLLAF